MHRSTISEDYLEQQKALHRDPNYGTASLRYAPIVRKVLEQAGLKSLSDYGAGKCNLRKALHDLGQTGLEYLPYDPAFPVYGPPKPADLVCCIDVLEHVEEQYLDAVFEDLERITTRIGFLTVHTGPAKKTLPDGRNAHIIQRPASWWLPLMCRHFEIVQMQRAFGGFWVITERKQAPTAA